MESLEERMIAALRQGGFKLTSQRQAVLRAVISFRSPFSPLEVYEKVAEEMPNIGLVTVYRTLEIFSKLGLLCELYREGGARSYIVRRPSGHHHHLICSKCGKVIDFTDCDLKFLEERLARETGFKIEAHFLQFQGLCPDCHRARR